MNTRHISLIAVIQTFALGGLLLISTLVAKWSSDIPAATHFRDYGIWSFVLIILWTALALYATKSASNRYSYGISFIGIAFVVFLLVAGIYLLAVGVAWTFPDNPVDLNQIKR